MVNTDTAKSFVHKTVLLQEAVEQLLQTPRGIHGTYLDGTFGRGGHSAALLAQLSQEGRVIGLDRDAAAVAVGASWADPRFTMVQGAFADLKTILNNLNNLNNLNIFNQFKIDKIDKIDGILLDIGVSSPQLDEAERGFSFNKTAALDMRMDTSQKITAADLVNTLSEAVLIRLFKDYGEEPQAARIAAAIVAARRLAPICTTTDLAALVERVVPFKKHGFHPATLIFQALRIEVNQELVQLTTALRAAQDCLVPQGRLAVISFHSLEDRLVKQAFRPTPVSAALRHLPRDETLHPWQEVARLKPTEAECKANPRARSAILRVATRQA